MLILHYTDMYGVLKPYWVDRYTIFTRQICQKNENRYIFKIFFRFFSIHGEGDKRFCTPEQGFYTLYKVRFRQEN